MNDERHYANQIAEQNMILDAIDKAMKLEPGPARDFILTGAFFNGGNTGRQMLTDEWNIGKLRGMPRQKTTAERNVEADNSRQDKTQLRQNRQARNTDIDNETAARLALLDEDERRQFDMMMPEQKTKHVVKLGDDEYTYQDVYENMGKGTVNYGDMRYKVDDVGQEDIDTRNAVRDAVSWITSGLKAEKMNKDGDNINWRTVDAVIGPLKNIPVVFPNYKEIRTPSDWMKAIREKIDERNEGLEKPKEEPAWLSGFDDASQKKMKADVKSGKITWKELTKLYGG
jgi:hypothetical protein